MPYVYTNPDKDASLETCDCVFILAQDPPDDLMDSRPAFADVCDSLEKARRLSVALQIKKPAPSDTNRPTMPGAGGGLPGMMGGEVSDLQLKGGEMLSSFIKQCTQDISKTLGEEIKKLSGRIDGMQEQLDAKSE